MDKKEDNQMSTYTKVIKKNKEKLMDIANINTKKNQDGLTVISKDDPWREETEWDELYKDLTKKS